MDNGWISLSDELPEEYKSVLVYDRKGHTFISWRMGRDWDTGENIYFDTDIVCWQPLPEPPQERK